MNSGCAGHESDVRNSRESVENRPALAIPSCFLSVLRSNSTGQIGKIMKPESVVTLPGTESVWTMGPGRSGALKLLNAQTNQSVMAFEEVTPAGVETPLHFHRDSDEIMYVLSGEYPFNVGERTETGGAGSVVFMPRGVGHA